MNHQRPIISFLCSLLILAAIAPRGLHAAIFNVTTSAEFQAALEEAEGNGEDDTINLAAGTYSTDDVNTFAGRGFEYLVEAGENFDLTIDGAGAGVTVLDGNDATSVLDIFTVGNSVDDTGALLTVRDLTIRNGEFVDGGGLAMVTLMADVVVRNCEFENNSADPFDGGGASIFNDAETPGPMLTMSNNVFTGNTAVVQRGGGLSVVGRWNVLLTDNMFTGNESAQEGAGANLDIRQGDISLRGNRFDDNHAGEDSGAVDIVVDTFLEPDEESSEVILVNNAFTNNTAGLEGGAVELTAAGRGSRAVLTHNSFTGNMATDGNGGGVLIKTFWDTAVIDVFNNILFDNHADTGSGADIFVDDDQDNNDIGTAVRLSHNDIGEFFSKCENTGGCAADVIRDDNIDADPLFADASNGDVHLLDGSPAIDAGTEDAPELPAGDFEGDSRDTLPDMGADEFVADPDPEPMPGTLQFSAAAYGVDEDAGMATIMVTRTGGSDGEVSVSFMSSDGTAMVGADYEFADGFLTWPDGDAAAKNFMVPVINDDDDEPDETVNLALSNPSNGAALGARDTAVLTIRDDDDPPNGVAMCGGLEATIVGTEGDDVIRGTSGPDVIHGLGGNDKIRGMGDNDVMCGGDGKDVIRGAGKNDLIFGEAGDDRLFGGGGNDRIFGGDGEDKIRGGPDDDELSGGADMDRLFGEQGNDDLDGGTEKDRCDGGAGNADTAANCEKTVNIP